MGYVVYTSIRINSFDLSKYRSFDVWYEYHLRFFFNFCFLPFPGIPVFFMLILQSTYVCLYSTMCIMNENYTFFDISTVEIVIDFDFSFLCVDIISSRPPGGRGGSTGRGTIPVQFQPTPPVYACVGLDGPCLFFWTAVATRRGSDRSPSCHAKKARWFIDRSCVETTYLTSPPPSPLDAACFCPCSWPPPYAVVPPSLPVCPAKFTVCACGVKPKQYTSFIGVVSILYTVCFVVGRSLDGTYSEGGDFFRVRAKKKRRRMQYVGKHYCIYARYFCLVGW